MQKLKTLLRTAVTHSPWHADRIRAAGLDVADGERGAHARRSAPAPDDDQAGRAGPCRSHRLAARSRRRLSLQYRRLQRRAAALLLRPPASGVGCRGAHARATLVGRGRGRPRGLPVGCSGRAGQDGPHQEPSRPPAQPDAAERIRNVRGEHGRVPGGDPGISAQVHLRLRQQRRVARRARQRAQSCGCGCRSCAWSARRANPSSRTSGR